MTAKAPEGLTIIKLGITESPIRCNDCRNPKIPKSISEYQKAYKVWPRQPVRQSYKPEPTKKSEDKAKSMLRKSTYGRDYVYHAAQRQAKIKKKVGTLKPPTKPMDTNTMYKMEYYPKDLPTDKDLAHRRERPKPETVVPQPDSPFDDLSMYTVSYPAYDTETIANCRMPPVKAKDNIGKGAGDIERNPKSTVQTDFVHHEKAERPEPVLPKENTFPSKEPMTEVSEYKKCYCDPSRGVKTKEKRRPFDAISTFMADYTDPGVVKRRDPCIPAKTRHPFEDPFQVTAPFDGQTTFGMAYKNWPAKAYELPSWAKKPVYKRPIGHMILKSLYKKDFADPKMAVKTDLMIPERRKVDIITNASGDKKWDYMSVYGTDFKHWEDVKAPASYCVIERYTPPKESMVCETNYRAHFKGEHVDKPKSSRHASQHLDLADSPTTAEFITTYNEDYVDPKSCPKRTKSLLLCKPVKSCSCHIPTPPPTPKTATNSPAPKPDSTKIPKPQVDKLRLPSPPTNQKTSQSTSTKDVKHCEICKKPV